MNEKNHASCRFSRYVSLLYTRYNLVSRICFGSIVMVLSTPVYSSMMVNEPVVKPVAVQATLNIASYTDLTGAFIGSFGFGLAAGTLIRIFRRLIVYIR